MSEDLVLDIFKDFKKEFDDFKKNKKGGLIGEYFKQKGQPLPKYFKIPNSRHEAIGFNKNKKIYGQCIVFYRNSDYYIGEVKNNKKHGFGFHHFVSGFVYKGLYENDIKVDGNVFDPKTKKIIYEGDWANDVYNGQGKLTKPNDGKYVGNFREGFFDGKGSLEYNNGDKYEGEFEKGKREGQGKFTFRSGEVYEGKFVANKFDGDGKYTWSNGDFYEGTFKEGELTGQGVMSYRELGVLGSGIWDNKSNPTKVDFDLEIGTNKELY